MTPVELLLARWDITVKKLAFLLDIHEDSIRKWRKIKGGKIPEKYHNRILELAKFRSERCLITRQELQGAGSEKIS